MRMWREEPMPDDPLGLTVDQRLQSDVHEAGGGLLGLAAVLGMACKLCRRYECGADCPSRLPDLWATVDTQVGAVRMLDAFDGYRA